MDIDGAGAAVVVVTPDLGEKLFPGPDTDRVLDQESKQFVLHEGEVDRLGGQRGLVIEGIQLEVLEHHQVVSLLFLVQPLDSAT